MYSSSAPVTLLMRLRIDNRAAVSLGGGVARLVVLTCLPAACEFFSLRQEFKRARPLGGGPGHGRRVAEGAEEPVCAGGSSYALPGGSQQGKQHKHQRKHPNRGHKRCIFRWMCLFEGHTGVNF